MRTKQTTLAANLSKAFKAASETLVTGIQEHINSKANIESSLVAIKRTKVKFGKSRATCAMLAYVYDQLGTIKTTKGTPLTATTKDGYLHAIKRAVNTGCELNLNSRRKPKPAGQSQTPKIKDKAKLTEDMADDGATVDPKLGKTNQEKIALMLQSILHLAQTDENPAYDTMELQSLIREAIEVV
jgi:hypothetical protein